MSSAQKQLLQRFRASATERLRRLAQQLAARAHNEANAAPLLEVARELHTLKGESRMLGLRAVSSIVHRAENALEQASHGRAEQAGPMYALVGQALDQTARVLQEDPGNDAAYAQALQGAQEALERADTALSAATSAPEAGAAPTGRVSLPPRAPQPGPAAAAGNSASSGQAATVTAQLPSLSTPAPAGAVVSSAATVPASMTSHSSEPSGDDSRAAGAERSRERSQRQERWVQVKADRIDALCGTIAELSAGLRALRMNARRVVQGTQRVDADSLREPQNTFLAPLKSIDPALERFSTQPSTSEILGHGDSRSLGADARSLIEDFERLQNQLDGIESAAWALRLVQIEPSLHDLAVHAKDLAQASSKRVRVIVEAGSVEIERPVLDTVWEPLLHILRNAIDHGIEPPDEREARGKPTEATLSIHAESAGPVVTLTVTDDGRGIAHEDVRRAAILRGLLPANHPPLSEQQAFDLLF